MGVVVCLLTDVQTSLKKVSSRGHGGQSRGSVEGLLPEAVLETHRGSLRRQGGGGVKHGG